LQDAQSRLIDHDPAEPMSNGVNSGLNKELMYGTTADL
jgi:hypothetical protein